VVDAGTVNDFRSGMAHAAAPIVRAPGIAGCAQVTFP
jgi:hypothetical protein